MKLGFIILAHQDLHRTGQLVRFLAKNDCAVSLHIDRNACAVETDQLKASLNNTENVIFSKREKCGWGQFSIVQATLNAAEALINRNPEISHVFLASGSCLPARPIKQLKAFLDRHENIDFIESVPVGDEKWVKDGLDRERFTLYFPLSWRKHRFAFDCLVELQRLLGIKRTIPEHISPHMGSQWWCLTTKTLRKIMDDPQRQCNDRYFSKTWISDESYFQSMVRRHSESIRLESLTFATFDSQGKPFLFYDDHLGSLSKTRAFFVRKVWPGADKLYRNLLTVNRKNFPLSKTNEDAFNKIYTDANEIRSSGGEGRFLQGRFPRHAAERSGVSHADFSIFTGFGFMFHNFPEWAQKTKGLNVFGNLFKRKNFTFNKNIILAKGNLAATTMLRDARPKGFLSNFLWSQKGKKRIGIMFDATDVQKIIPDITRDERAHFVVVKEAWLIAIANSRMRTKGKVMRAKVLQARERKFLKSLAADKHAGCTVFTLKEALSTPGLVVQAALKTLEPEQGAKPIIIPQLSDLSKLDALVRKLGKNGVSLSYKPGRKKIMPKRSEKAVNRPYVVR